MKCRKLSFAVTYHCNFKCAHCCVYSSPETFGPVMSADKMISVIDEVCKKEGKPELVAFTGGEPLLKKQEVLKTMRFCKEQNIPTRMLTNAGWAKNPEVADKQTRELKEAGMWQYAVSYSQYHGQFLEFDNYVHLVEAAQKHDISVQFLVTKDTNREMCPYKLREKLSEKLLKKIKLKENLIEIIYGDVTANGRASSLDKSYFRTFKLKEADLFGCTMVLNPMYVTAEDRIMVCCGFPYKEQKDLEIGTYTGPESVSNSIDAVRKNLVIRWIHSAGPWNILKKLLPDKYNDETNIMSRHICEGCRLLFTDKEAKERLNQYIAEKGERLLFEDCFEPFKEKDKPVELTPA